VNFPMIRYIAEYHGLNVFSFILMAQLFSKIQ